MEDNRINQKLAVPLFQEIGCEHISVAQNGKQAVEMLVHESYDLVFMDCQVPEMGGYEATAEIRNRFCNYIPIIAMTANAMQEDREKCLKAGMDDYSPKPVQPDALKEAVLNWSSAVSKTANMDKIHDVMANLELQLPAAVAFLAARHGPLDQSILVTTRSVRFFSTSFNAGTFGA